MKAKGTVVFNGNENDTTTEVIYKGLDHLHREFGNDQFHAVVVLAGDKGWRKFGDNSSTIEGDAVANEKRNIYLAVIPITIVPLKNNGFKVEAAGEEKVGDKPAVILKVTAPTARTSPSRSTRKAACRSGRLPRSSDSRAWSTPSRSTYSDYKDFGGIKKATKLAAQARWREVPGLGSDRVQGAG